MVGSTRKEFKSNSRECSDCKRVRIYPFKARSLLQALFSLIAGKFIRSEEGTCIDRLKKKGKRREWRYLERISLANRRTASFSETKRVKIEELGLVERK